MGIAIKKVRRAKRSEAGTALVETAITMIAFFLLVVGAMEAGRLLNIQQVLTNAAREGARLGVAPAPGTNNLPNAGAIQARVNTYLTSANIVGAAVTVTPIPASSCWDTTTTCTKVTVQLPYTIMSQSPLFNAFQVTLQGQSVMRNETSN